jgi:hypothetical protein
MNAQSPRVMITERAVCIDGAFSLLSSEPMSEESEEENKGVVGERPALIWKSLASFFSQSL